jgi:AcrR family transcriptional regulator
LEPDPVPYHHGNLREVLLEKAAEAIEEDGGIGALSLRAVARRAGVSHGAPAHHFRDKAGLLTALATQAMDRFRATLSDAAREAGGSEREKLRAIGMAYVCFAAEHPALFRIITRSEFIRRDDPEFSASYQSTIDTVKDAVIAAQREGWGRDMDPMALVITAWSTAHGLATLWLDGVLEDRVGPVDLEAVAAHAFEVLMAV